MMNVYIFMLQFTCVRIALFILANLVFAEAGVKGPDKSVIFVERK